MKTIVLAAFIMIWRTEYINTDITSPYYNKEGCQYLVEDLLTHQYKTDYFDMSVTKGNQADTFFIPKEEWDELQDTLIKRPIKPLDPSWIKTIESTEKNFKVI